MKSLAAEAIGNGRRSCYLGPNLGSSVTWQSRSRNKQPPSKCAFASTEAYLLVIWQHWCFGSKATPLDLQYYHWHVASLCARVRKSLECTPPIRLPVITAHSPSMREETPASTLNTTAMCRELYMLCCTHRITLTATTWTFP